MKTSFLQKLYVKKNLINGEPFLYLIVFDKMIVFLFTRVKKRIS